MNANAQVVVAETQNRSINAVTLPAVINDSAALMTAIAAAAKNPKTDVAKMERLMAMFERMEARTAEAAFNDAMCDAQAEMRPIAADCDNAQTRSQYASYAALDRALRPIYTRHRFAISYNTGESKKPDHILVYGYVSRGGFTRTYQVDMPNDGKGAKGGDVMTKTHATGAGMAYGMRYLLKMIFNVAVGEDDRDGNDQYVKISERQAADLDALVSEVGANKVALLTYLKVQRLADIPAENYTHVVRLVEAKRAQGKPAQVRR